MKIVQILPELNVGGVETGTIDLAKALKKRGHEPFVISNGGVLVDELVKYGIPHIQMPVHKKSLSSLRLVKKITDFLERECIDIIHARSRIPAWLAYLAVRRTNCDFVTTCHGYYSKHFMSRVMGWGKKVIVISHSIGRRMIDDFGVPPERITLIHRGVDLSQYNFDPNKYHKPAQQKLKIINIGRLTPIKGHTEFIRAIHILSKRFSNFEAKIIGGPDRGKSDYFDQLKLMVERLGLGSFVQFLGSRRDIPALINEADVLVLSSKIPEAFGRVLIEAGAVGTVVCASRIGGILDVIEDEKNGLLFAPEHIEGMAAAMERLLRDRALCAKFSSALHSKVIGQFTLDQMVDRTVQVYDDVKNQKRILITKLGALGDIVLAIPSFRMIRHRYPHAKISLLVDGRFASVVENCPYIDEIVTIDRGNKAKRLKKVFYVGRKLVKQNFDMSIDLQNNWLTHLIAFIARIPKRFGYRRGWLGFLLTHPVVFWDHKLAPVQHQFQVLKRAGVLQFDDTMELWARPESEQVIKRKLAAAGFDATKRTVGLVLGSSPLWPSKRWPIERFVQLAEKLCRRKDCQVILLGTKEDLSLSKFFTDTEAKSIINFVGETSIPELVALVKSMDVLVTGDTAPLHIGAGFNKKMVTLFGPTEPKRHVPPGNGVAVIAKHLPCQPCYQGICRNKEYLKCLRDVSVDEVLASVEEHLGS